MNESRIVEQKYRINPRFCYHIRAYRGGTQTHGFKVFPSFLLSLYPSKRCHILTTTDHLEMKEKKSPI